VHYDGLSRPSEIKIQTIGLWIRFYDLPHAMMKPAMAKQLGNQVGKFFKSDSIYPGYLRVRVDFPLTKPLMPELMVKIKGRGQMQIIIWYENVPHFCFACGHIGHAAVNCDEIPGDNSGVKFGEELRSSPPRHVKQIPIKVGMPKAARPLFQVADQSQFTKPSTSSLLNQGTRTGMEGGDLTKGEDSTNEGDVWK
jgi:hypothetical protein